MNTLRFRETKIRNRYIHILKFRSINIKLFKTTPFAYIQNNIYVYTNNQCKLLNIPNNNIHI